MGTKRNIVDRVRATILGLESSGKVLDLFSGVGSVAESLSCDRSVVTNDVLSFTVQLSRARFTAPTRSLSSHELISRLRAPYRDAFSKAQRRNRERLRDEQTALLSGRTATARYIARAEHMGNSEDVANHVMREKVRDDYRRYCLTANYFAAGYFSLRQCLQLDALRFAIDQSHLLPSDLDWALASWIGATAAAINAPGHTAQYLKPNSEPAFKRIRRCWQRDIWTTFQDQVVSTKLVGTQDWRRRNRAVESDAIRLLQSEPLPGVGVVYADPPYTKDQYSRYYHVYETLSRYDFPDATGEGRARSDRFSSSFCLVTGVEDAFTDLFDAASDWDVPLVLSYPSNGLLSQIGASVEDFASTSMKITSCTSFNIEHSTLGASKGTQTKTATENIYVCVPA